MAHRYRLQVYKSQRSLLTLFCYTMYHVCFCNYINFRTLLNGIICNAMILNQITTFFFLQDGRASREKDIAKSIILSVAYAANIGGIATLIGTPANLILKENADA